MLEPARTGNSALPARLPPRQINRWFLLLLWRSADPSPLQMGLLHRERRATSKASITLHESRITTHESQMPIYCSLATHHSDFGTLRRATVS